MYSRLLVAGTARGGTTFASKVLKHFVPNTTHEYWGVAKLGQFTFPQTIEVTGTGISYVQGLSSDIKPVLQLRNPLKVVKRHVWSWLPPEGDPSHQRYKATILAQNATYRHIFGRDMRFLNEDLWDMACAYIFDLWDYALGNIEFSYKIEEFADALPIILGFIGVIAPPETVSWVINGSFRNSKASLVNPDIWYEKRGYGDLSPELQDLSKELGYHD